MHGTRWSAPISALLVAFTSALAFASPLAAPRLAAAQPSLSIHVEVDAALVLGEAAPGAVVDVLAFDARGVELHRWRTTAAGDGRFGVSLTLSGGRIEEEVLRLEPGMSIGVDVDERGDPTLIAIPELTAHADIDRESITGVAPRDHRVLAEVHSAGSVLTRTLEAPVGADGRFEVPLAGMYDVEPAAVGRLTAIRPDGHRLSLAWVARRNRLVLESGDLWIETAAGRDIDVRLVGADGTLRGSTRFRARRVTTFNRRVTEIAHMVDPFGMQPLPAPGDVVEGTLGGEPFRFVVPRLQAAVHAQSDRVDGSTDAIAGTTLRLDAADRDARSATRTQGVAPGGAFSFDLAQADGAAAPFDLRHNAAVTLRLEARADRFSRRIVVPGLVLDLGGARLSGSLEPGAASTARWRRSGRDLGEVAVRADAGGAFEVGLRHADGTRFDLQAGDEVAVEGADGGTGMGTDDAVRMVVPRLDLELDPVANALGGRVERAPGSGFRLSTRRLQTLPDTVLDSGRWDASLTWLDAERFTIDFDDHPVAQPFGLPDKRFTVVTGAVADAELILPDGHRATRSRVMPVLHVQHGGNLVCGQADPDLPVDVRLSGDSGEALAAARSVTGADGRFASRLAGADGPAHLREGMRLAVDVGGQPLALALPPLTVAFDWTAHALRLHGLPNQDYAVRYPGLATDCWVDTTDELSSRRSLFFSTARVTTQPDGIAAYDAKHLYDSGASPTDGLLIQTTDPSLHRVYTFVYGLAAEVHLGTTLVRGRSSPYRTVTARLQGEHHAFVGQGTTETDGEGRFALRLTSERGKDPRGQYGTILTLATEGDVATLSIPALNFDFNADAGVAGTAPPATDVALTLRLADGRAVSTTAATDMDARFAFTPADVPPGAGWTLADVTSVRAEYGFARYHRVVRDSADDTDPGPLPGRGWKVFLPWMGNR